MASSVAKTSPVGKTSPVANGASPAKRPPPPIDLSGLQKGITDIQKSISSLDATFQKLISVSEASLLPDPPEFDGEKHGSLEEWILKMEMKLEMLPHLSVQQKVLYVASRTSGKALMSIKGKLPVQSKRNKVTFGSTSEVFETLKIRFKE